MKVEELIDRERPASMLAVQTPATALCARSKVAALDVVEAEGWRARSDTPRVPLPDTRKSWNADPFGDRNWTFQLHAWRPLDPFLVAYEDTGEAGHLSRAVDMCLGWEEAEAASDNQALYWNDMGAGLRASKLGYIVYRLRREPVLSASTTDRVVGLARRHMRRLKDPAFMGPSNHAFFQIHGLMALFQALPDSPEAEGCLAYLTEQLDKLLLDQFGVEGMHLEHSPGYHLFAIHTLRKMLDSGWYEALPHARAVLDLALEHFNWLVFPDGTISRAGDSERGKYTYSYGRGHGRGQRGRLFREAGFAVVRGGGRQRATGSMLFVTAGHHSNVHKHADDLSFELYDKGRFWIVDTGKFSYSRLDWRRFTDSARAHNTVVYSPDTDDNGLRATKPAGGMLHKVERDGYTWLVEGRVERPSLGAVHERAFHYTPGVSLVIEDALSFSTPRDVVAWLHLASDLEAEREEAGWRLPGARITYSVEGSPIDLDRVRGQEHPQLQGWTAPRYHRILPNDALGARLRGKRIKLITTLTFE